MKTETQQTVTQWALDTFGPCAVPRAVERMVEEMQELQAVPHQDAMALRDECADVLITMYRLASVMGFDLHEAVSVKMALNRSREWVVRGDGTGQHAFPGNGVTHQVVV
mgnify:CR=1 FL=1